MSADSSHADDIAMKGGGYYSLATKGAKDVIDMATPLVMRALDGIDLAGHDGPFTMADMGCADGGTSIDMIGQVVERIRAAAPTLPISMVYTDQPNNDYNALFRIVYGMTDIPTALPGYDNVHMFASATSFYREILPPATLDLGFSATAMHWLSAKPGDISDHVQAVGASGRELAAFVEQGRKDWERILLCRAAELAPGGRMVMVNFGKDEQGRYLGNTGGVHMFDTFNEIWRSFVADRVVTEAEYVAATLPQYYKTLEEFTDPLTDPASAVYRAGLRLEHAETRVVACPYAAEFRADQSRGEGDPAAFARAYIPTLRSWTESTFFAALAPGRPIAERREIIDAYYDDYEARVRSDPAGHGMDYVHAYMIVSKT